MKVKVTLKRDHEDAGRQYQSGDVLEVDEGTAAWLSEQGVIDAPSGKSKPRETTRDGN
jgi:hypothetical protein